MEPITVQQQEVLDEIGVKKLLKMKPGDICFKIWDYDLCSVPGGRCIHCQFFNERDNIKGESEYSENLKILQKIKKLKL